MLYSTARHQAAVNTLHFYGTRHSGRENLTLHCYMMISFVVLIVVVAALTKRLP